MSRINRESVREEAERLKVEVERLSLDKKIDSETKILIRSLFMLINLLMAIFLEKTTSKNNKNSSKPSSQTEKDESSLSAGSKGKGKPVK
jgi:transposase